jgi:hypothetical protein
MQLELELDKLRGNDVAKQSQEKHEALLHEIEKLRGNEEESIDEAQRLHAQNKVLLQYMQELHGSESLLEAKIQALTEKLRCNDEELLHEKDRLQGLDKQLRALKEKLHSTIGQCLNSMVEAFEKIQEALGKQHERETLRDNETQEFQKSLKELRVNYEELLAEKHSDTLGNTVREKITVTPLSTAQEKWETSMFQDPYKIYCIMLHIKEQLQQPNCDNIPTLRAQLQVAEAEYSRLTRMREEIYDLEARHTYEIWLRNKPVAAV